MTMKVTNQMTFRLMQSEINTISKRLQDLRQEAATGKRFNKPSDDPSAVRPVLNYNRQIRANQRFQENMGMAHNKLQAQDSYLDNAEDTLVRAKQHTIRAISGALNENDREIIADQVHQMKNELLGTANAQLNGRYIFAGYEEETQPFQEIASGEVNYQGDDHAKKVEIAPGEKLDVSIPGSELFLGSKDVDKDSDKDNIGANVFETLNNIEKLIRTGDKKVSGSFGGSYDGWEHDDSNNYDEISFDLSFAGHSLTDGSNISVDMNDVNTKQGGTTASHIAGSLEKKLNDLTGSKPEGIKSITGDVTTGSGLVVEDVDGNELTIKRNGNSFDFQTTNNASFEITDFSQTATDDDASTEPNSSAEMNFSWSDGQQDITLRSGSIRSTTLNGHLESLDDGATRIRKYRGEMGINMNRVETSIDAKAQAENDLKQILGKYENADIAETSSQIVQRETALKAALNVTSRMAEISILNYM